jgi:hypothetical protein
MPELSLVGLSEDGRSLVLTAGTDETYSVRLDERLRAAVVSDRVRLGQLELELGTALRPKDIQARIRSGEQLEDVAAAAGVPPERIMTYAAPVLSERAHVASQARRSVLRRTEATGPRALADVVTDRLQQRGVAGTAVAWDAWRRDDGKWTVTAAYRSGEHDRTALFVFDPLARVVVAGDDEARWLAGEGRLHAPQPRTASRDPGETGAGGASRSAGEGRLTVVGSDGERDELFDQDADQTRESDERLSAADSGRAADGFEDRNPTVTLAPVPPDQAAPEALALDGPSRATDTGDRPRIPADLAADEVADLDDETYAQAPEEPVAATGRARRRGRERTQRVEPEPSAADEEPTAQPVDSDEPAEDATTRRKPARKRAAVPSWDDILFGTRSE